LHRGELRGALTKEQARQNLILRQLGGATELDLGGIREPRDVHGGGDFGNTSEREDRHLEDLVKRPPSQVFLMAHLEYQASISLVHRTGRG
jgi:hypothetical protein